MAETMVKAGGAAEEALKNIETISGENPALAGVNRAFMDRVKTLGFPHKKHEMFTFVDTSRIVNALSGARRKKRADAPAEPTEGLVFPGSGENLAVILDGYYEESLSAAGAGVSARRLDGALAEGWVENRLTACVDEETDVFAAAAGALMTDGVVVEIAPGVKLSAPLQILMISTSPEDAPFLAAPRVLLKAGEGSSAEVIVKNGGGGVVLSSLDVILERGASLGFYDIQAEDESALSLGKTRAVMAGDSRLEAFIAFGGLGTARKNFEARLMEEGAALDMKLAAVLTGAGRAHSYVRVHHEAPRCESDQLFRDIVGGSARVSVDGTVIVHPGAQLARSTQLVNNLLLSDEARADTKPNLMIYADDVKCSHGATSGSVDEEMLFYLRTRGFSEKAARALLTTGFIRRVLDAVANRAVAEAAAELLLPRLEA